MLSAILSDFRHGYRVLRKTPGFTLVALLILAVGIGANTAIFSVVNALLLRALPVTDPARVVFVSMSDPQRHLAGGGFSVAAYENLRDGGHSFEGIAAVCGEGFTLTGRGEPESLAAARVAPNFFDVLGVRPMMGRAFEPEEGGPGGRPVALISHNLWTRRFSSDQNIVGKPIALDQDAYTIIGVLPPDFPFPYQGTDVWVSRVMNFGGFQPEQIRAGAGYLTAVARLRPGVTIPQAEAESAVLAQQYRQEHPNAPDADPGRRLDVVTLQESLVTGIRTTLLILMGAVGVVLLIACANIASLMLARATGRAREVAIRAAIGASRGSLVRQLLTESLLLAAAGSLLGVVLARWSIPGLVKLTAGTLLPGYQQVRLDPQVLLFTAGVSVVAGILFGLAPAIQLSRPDLNAVLRDSGWGTTGGAARHRTRGMLVAGQIALSVVLLVGATLLIESFRNLQKVNPGFNPHHVLTMNVGLPPGKYPDGIRRAQFFQNVVQRMSTLPGVRAAVASGSRPMNLMVLAPILADGQPAVPYGRRPLAVWNVATPGYFQTFGIPLLRGRDFTWSDDGDAPKVTIVSQSLADRFWPGQNPLGKHIRLTRLQIPFEIVGVAGDTHTNGLQRDPGMVVFTPYPQWTFPAMTISLRTAGDPRQIANVAVAQVQAQDRDQAVTNVRTADELMDTQFAQSRQTMYLIAGFAAVALLLALIGLYGALAYSVAQRRVEIGIRQALGAQPGDILRLITVRGLQLALAGTAAGVAVAACATRLLSSILFQVKAVDPLTFGAIAGLFLLVAAAASLIPAWQATRVDPQIALRSQ